MVAATQDFLTGAYLITRKSTFFHEAQMSYFCCFTCDAQVCTPFILHPTPYTLHPTPCTLHLQPCTLHPTPCTLHPAPYTLHRTPYTSNPIGVSRSYENVRPLRTPLETWA